jgi:hypothetical protein
VKGGHLRFFFVLHIKTPFRASTSCQLMFMVMVSEIYKDICSKEIISCKNKSNCYQLIKVMSGYFILLLLFDKKNLVIHFIITDKKNLVIRKEYVNCKDKKLITCHNH